MSTREKFNSKQILKKNLKVNKVNKKTLGELIKDFGSSALYLTSIDDVKNYNIKIWKKQRSLNKERVNEIVENQKGLDEPDFMGNIIFCEFDGIFYIIDGQHRYNAMIELSKIYSINFVSEVYFVDSDEEIQNRFLQINKSIPVPLYNLDETGIAEKVTISISSDYQTIFKHNVKKRVNRPNIDINNFKNCICKIMTNINDDSSKSIEEKILNQNEYYKNKYSKDDYYKKLGIISKQEKEIFLNAYRKAESEEFYLGLFGKNEWVDDIIKKYKDDNLVDFSEEE